MIWKDVSFFFWTTNWNFICGQAFMLNMDIQIKVSFKSKNVWKWILHLKTFANYQKLNVLILIAPTRKWNPNGHFGVWKRWSNKTYKRSNKSKSCASWFVTKWNVWLCGIGSNIFLKTEITFVCLSLSARHCSE